MYELSKEINNDVHTIDLYFHVTEVRTKTDTNNNYYRPVGIQQKWISAREETKI